MGILNISDESSLQNILSSSGNQLVVLHFSAAWAPQCKQMNEVMEELSKDVQYSNVQFVQLEAEDLPDVSEKYEITAVPTFIFIKNKAQIDRIDGAKAADLTKKVKLLSSGQTGVPLPVDDKKPRQDLNTRLKNLISSAPVMLFMKGDPDTPRCGFSRQITQLLKEKGIKFSSFDILQDEEVRQGLKTYSNWPTYPQLYANGELVGGVDIVKELIESGELESQLPKQTSLEDRLKSLITKSDVMLFMKGDPDTPRCGFSKQMTSVLADTGVKYDTFDILSDDEVRQGLKTYSNWPTYPQLYVKGELIGGLDIVKELKESGELESVLKGE